MLADRNAEDRFWAKVNRDGPGGCWVWTACLTRGYGQFAWSPGVLLRSHRVAYELLVGPIPDGLVLDHLCRNKACVNPVHLEPVTQAENLRRADATRTHCPHGHERNEANTYVRPDGRRQCRICMKASKKATAARFPVAENHRICSEDECDEPARTRGLCRSHYNAWYYREKTAPRRKAEKRNDRPPIARRLTPRGYA